MSKRFRVNGEHTFTYPADPLSLRAILDAQGMSNMSEEDKAKLKMKTVGPGGDCSDMPASSLAIYLERGWVVEELNPKKEGK